MKKTDTAMTTDIVGSKLGSRAVQVQVARAQAKIVNT